MISQPIVTLHAGIALDLEGDRAAISSSRGIFLFIEPFVSFHERALDGTWNLVTNVDAPTTGRNFGASVSISGDWAVVGDPGITGQAGRAYGARFSAGQWAVVGGFMTAPASFEGDRFGSSVDLDGDRALVGAPGASGDTGAAHVFQRNPITGLWDHVAELVPSSVTVGDQIGASVAWSNGRAYIGAPRSELAGADAGAVFVFEETAPGTWTEAQALVGDSLPGNLFGSRIAIDGDLLAVNAAGEPATASLLPGTTFVYEFDGQAAQWNQVDAVRSPIDGDIGFNPTLLDVALEGEDLVIAHAANIGAVHVFERTSAGTWRVSVGLETEAMINLPPFPFPTYWFGYSLALDGGRLLVGATGEQPAGLFGPSGAAREFNIGTLYHGKRTVLLPGPDVQPHHLRATDARAGDYFYFVGTGSGTTPGTFDAPSGITVPINVDAFTLFFINSGGAGLSNPVGVLDANGEAQSSYTMPAGLSPSFAGLELHYCYLIIDSTTFAFDQVSNPVPVRIQ